MRRLAALLCIICALAGQGRDQSLLAFCAAGGASFSPISVSGCVLWLDLGDTSKMYDAVTGGSLVTNNGAVARLEDKSGYGYHATNAVATARPKRSDASFGGKTSCVFDNTDLFSFPRPMSTTGTVFLVHNPGYNAQYITLKDAVANAYVYVATSNSTTAAVSFSSGTPSYYLNGSATNWANRGIVWSSLAAQNSVTVSAGVSFTAWTSAAWQVSGYASLFYVGNIAEVIIYDRILTDANRKLVEAYLGTKWGITVAP